MEPEPHYDLFVSYRSNDVHIVRPIAEQLMAAGLRVWFAEYEILLAGRQHFDTAILRGVSHCSYGLCFTNDGYARSQHCQNELELLINRLGPGRIVEIRCPNEPSTHDKFPDLRHAHIFDYSDLVQVLVDIHSGTGYDTQTSRIESPAPANWHDFSASGLRFSLDFGGWQGA